VAFRYVKVAEKKSKPAGGPNALKDVGGAYLAGTAVQMGTGVGAVGVGRGAQAVHNQSGTLSPKELRDLRKAMNARVPIVKMSPAAAKEMGGAYVSPLANEATQASVAGNYDDARRAMAASKGDGFIAVPGGKKGKASLLAHEMGHASKNTSGIKKMPYMLATSLGGRVGAAAALVTGYKSTRSADKPQTRVEDLKRSGLVGAATGLVGSSPLLFEEGRASIRASRGLKAIGRSRKSRAITALANAGGWGSYAGMAAATGAGSGILGGGVGRFFREDAASKAKKTKVKA
jgi:hypothetical protein